MSQAPADTHDQSNGWILVGAQFALIALLVLIAIRAPVPSLIRGLIAAMLALDGLALLVLTVIVNRVGNWRIHPTPKANATLVTNGPYRLVRHPMYGAVLLVSLAVILWSSSAWSVLVTALLCAVLVGKIQIEERQMQQRYGQAYQNYMTHTRRVIPGVW